MTLVAQVATVISTVTGIASLVLLIRAERKRRDDDRPGGKHRKT